METSNGTELALLAAKEKKKLNKLLLTGEMLVKADSIQLIRPRKEKRKPFFSFNLAFTTRNGTAAGIVSNGIQSNKGGHFFLFYTHLITTKSRPFNKRSATARSVKIDEMASFLTGITKRHFSIFQHNRVQQHTEVVKTIFFKRGKTRR